ncbi:MAG: glmS [Gammaproteobacteria bacterium]|jgi:glucosamine--fructose-6-phosphate aminotransferase (isomerizing)|nr:glmS [Gammaproteobacteria bacterium]
MCGIVGAISSEDVIPILLEGLKRLEYRGYDSAGVATLNCDTGDIQRLRTKGKVKELESELIKHPMQGRIGIAHTRWATHGIPSEGNAHPLISGANIAVVHNGIIENHHELKTELLEKGYIFASDTDTEVVAHLVYDYHKQHDFLAAVKLAIKRLEGAFALVIINREAPDRLIAVRKGSPLVVGLGKNSHFIASDTLALLPVTDRFIFLEEGDVADVSQEKVDVYDLSSALVKRKIHTSGLDKNSVSRGNYRHFMLKEIFEQTIAAAHTLDGRIDHQHVLDNLFDGPSLHALKKIQHVQIAACGTSYHAGLVGRYWMESLAGISCQTEIASEIRYRKAVVSPNSLFIVLSQSGETADTLAALRQAKELGYAATLAICNVPESSLTREADITILTRAGAEIGVASTKAFTTQLIALLLLTMVLGAERKFMGTSVASNILYQLRALPSQIERTLTLNTAISELAARFVGKQHALFLGRGVHYPIALEGALKLKELSYIHAEAYPAGELKHGPLALVDHQMPVIAVAPSNTLLEKVKSNLQEVSARGGELIVFGDASSYFQEFADLTFIPVQANDDVISPIIYTIPLQLLAYHVAVLKGTDVDQPRNLAKSVTVE